MLDLGSLNGLSDVLLSPSPLGSHSGGGLSHLRGNGALSATSDGGGGVIDTSQLRSFSTQFIFHCGGRGLVSVMIGVGQDPVVTQ